MVALIITAWAPLFHDVFCKAVKTVKFHSERQFLRWLAPAFSLYLLQAPGKFHWRPIVFIV